MKVADVRRFADVHHAFNRKTLAEIVFVAEISAFEFKADVVLVVAETAVEVLEHLDYCLAFRLFDFGILRLG